MRILLACEESGRVREAFRGLGWDAYSCDILPTAIPSKFHLQCDVATILRDNWDMMIAFPPCTHLSSSGAAWWEEKRKDGRQQSAIDFFLSLANAPIPRIAIENPVGIMSSVWRKPDQIIHPWQFGDEFEKTTCLWLKNLPKLQPTKIVGKGDFVVFSSGKKMPKWYAEALRLPRAERAKLRSKTFPGIAAAMASQWGAPTSALIAA